MDLNILNAIINYFSRGHIEAINEAISEIEEETNADRKVIRKHIEIAELLGRIEKVDKESE